MIKLGDMLFIVINLHSEVLKGNKVENGNIGEHCKENQKLAEQKVGGLSHKK